MNSLKLLVNAAALLSLSALVILGLIGCRGVDNSALESKTDKPAVGVPKIERNIYTNEKYGYTFKYPNDCYFGQMPRDCKEKPPEERRAECLCFLDSTNPDRVFLQAFLGERDQLSLAGFVVSHSDSLVFNPPPGTDLASWIDKNFSEMFAEIPGEPNMDLNGTPAVRVIYPRSAQSPGFESIYVIHNDQLIEIQLLSTDIEDNMELYDQILSTLEFEN